MTIYPPSSAGMLRIESNRFTAVLFRATLFAAVFGLSFTMACARIAETPSSPLVWLRMCVAVAALAIIAFSRRGNLLRRALLAFALESASGVATLLYVDVPYVDGHAQQIAAGVTAGYHCLTKRDILADLRELRSAR